MYLEKDLTNVANPIVNFFNETCFNARGMDKLFEKIDFQDNLGTEIRSLTLAYLINKNLMNEGSLDEFSRKELHDIADSFLRDNQGKVKLRGKDLINYLNNISSYVAEIKTFDDLSEKEINDLIKLLEPGLESNLVLLTADKISEKSPNKLIIIGISFLIFIILSIILESIYNLISNRKKEIN